MIGKRNVIRLPYRITVSANGTGTISSDRVQSGQMLVCQSVAFCNETGARGTASLQIRNISDITNLGDQLTPIAATWYFYNQEQHLREGEQIEISQASCLQNDVLNLQIVGYIEDKSPKAVTNA